MTFIWNEVYRPLFLKGQVHEHIRKCPFGSAIGDGKSMPSRHGSMPRISDYAIARPLKKPINLQITSNAIKFPPAPKRLASIWILIRYVKDRICPSIQEDR